MSVVRRYWFPACVLLLLGVIAVNLHTLRGARPGAEEASGPAAGGHQPGLASANQGDPRPAGKDHAPGAPAVAQPGDGHQDHKDHMHPGMMGKGMMGMMGGPMADMMDIRYLLAQHKAIERTVKRLPDGVETVTTSTDQAVAAKLQQHVKAMYERLRKRQVIRPMDPLFAALFENADKIDAAITTVPNGVRVKETSKDAYTVKLIQAHAEAVDRFVREGMTAMMKTTPAPKRE